VSFQKKTTFHREGAAVSRYSTLDSLFRTAPPFGAESPVPSNVLRVVELFAVPGGELTSKAIQLLNHAQRLDPNIVEGKLSLVFSIMRADREVDFTVVLMNAASKSYARYKAEFEANVDVLFMVETTRAAMIFQNMAAGGSGKALAPHAERFLVMVESGGVKMNMESVFFGVLASCAGADPTHLESLVDRVYAAAITLPRCDVPLANFIANVAKSETQGAAIQSAGLLCKMLHEPTLSDNGTPAVLSSLVNIFALLRDTSILAPHIAVIKSHETKCGILVEKIVDW
jgi:hypothetical protein